jgi:uncharacterized protein YkwD
MLRTSLMLCLAAVLSCTTTSGARRTPTREARPEWSDRLYSPFDERVYREISAEQIDADHLDRELVAATIWRETNAIREKHGLQALGYCAPCRRAAQEYSDDMVRRDFFLADHGHPDKSRATPRLRMDAAQLVNATGWGENIAVTFALQYKSGRPFYLPEKAGDPYLDEHQKPLLPHSYQSFAQSVVEQWMNSPHHRANILDKDWTHFGAACTSYREKDGFPKLKCTQDFARLAAVKDQSGRL